MSRPMRKITRAILFTIGIFIVKYCMFIDSLLDKILAERN